MRVLALALTAALVASGVADKGAAQDLIPERRLVYQDNADLPGGDFANQRDITLEGCETACLTDGRCEAFTFNTRFGACFLKNGAGEAAFYQGAFSARVLAAATGSAQRAAVRRGELAFLGDADLGAATTQALRLAGLHITGTFSVEQHLTSAAEAERRGDFAAAAAFTGAALNLTDSATGWLAYARLSLLAARPSSADQGTWRDRAIRAATNAYLRAENPAARHTILVVLAEALEKSGRGRDGLQALRLAQQLQRRDDTERMLEDFIGKYGSRITEHQIQSDSAEPRLCAVFSDTLPTGGVDFATFVQMTAPGLSVERTGDQQLCVEGLVHGQRAEVTFRAGLPAADGQTLVKSVTLTGYVRDRTPAIWFPGRGYVLPKGPEAAVPVATVNMPELELSLFRVDDRNMLRAIQNDYFGSSMEPWREEGFDGQVGQRVWTGTASVPSEINRDMTTRLPLTAALQGREAGIYMLKAKMAGADEYERPPAWQWFVVSDLGLTTFWGTDGLTVAVRALGTTQPRAGVTVELLGRANTVLATLQTDDQGLVRFPAGLTRGTGGARPALIVARDGETDVAFLSLSDSEFDLSDRGVEGREAPGPVDVFVGTERGAYRPGETVFATALARDGNSQAVTGVPLTAIWRRPDGVEYARAVVRDTDGGYVLSQPIAGNAPRGTWRVDLLADLDAGPLATLPFLVEDFLPERIDFALTLPDRPLRLGDVPEVTVDAKYLFGAPGADLAIEGEVLLTRAPGLPGWPGYLFGRHDARFSAQMEPIEGGTRTDDAGRAQLAAPLPLIDDPGVPLQARFAVRVAEGSGRPVERRIEAPLQPQAAMIGVRPLFDDVVPENGQARFAVAGVGADGKAAALPVSWELNRLETRYQWYQDYGSWYWDSVVTRSRVARGDLTTGPDPVEIAGQVQWGEYELVLTSGQTATSTTFYAGWYAPADLSATPDTLQVGLDAASYKPGDTARVRVVSRAAGTALVAVLSDRLISLQSVELAEGETVIPVTVTDDWAPGAYVTVSALRPMDVAAGRNPARALGLAHAAVDPGPRKLAVTIETAPEAMPRGPMQVAVRVDGIAAGETAHVTLAAVDVGILNLTGFKAPDPSAHYLGRRKLGVGIRDLYGRLIDGMSGAAGEVRSGGDSGAQARLQADPPTEELVAYFTGPVTVGADGYARASFDLPAFNGTVKVMAVAWSPKGVGQASADVLVRDPVVVTASLPRFMAPGDESRLLLEIVHARGPAGRVGLDVFSAGLTVGVAESGFELTVGGKKVVSVPVRADAPGIQTAEIRIVTPDGRTLSKTVSLVVRANDPEVARLSRFDLAPGQSFTFDANALAGLDPATATATMALGPIARMNAPGLLAALDRYPYGCTEQLTSRAMPLIYFDQVAQAMRLKGADDIRTRISQAVTEILLNQNAEGGFGLWRPSSGDFWLDAYVTDFLSRARTQGFDIPDQPLRRALDNLRNQVNYAGDFDNGGEALAYALMVLAREGAAAMGDLRYYADIKADDFATPLAKAQIGAALAAYGDQERADAMFRKAAASLAPAPDSVQIYRADYGTTTRDAAAVLALATEAGSMAVDRDALVNRLAGRQNLSTQEAVWMLMATRALLDVPGLDGVTLNGAPASGPIARLIEPGATDPVVVANGSGRPQTLTITAFGVPTEPEPAGGNGYAITRSYYGLDGQPVDLSAGVKAGTRLAVVLEVTPYGSGEARLMVTDPLPAGLEIDNPNLLTGGQISALDWLQTDTEVEHSEFRQDRFLTAVDRYDAQPFTLAYIVRAVSPGTFHHPAPSVEDMYRPDFRARGETGRMTVTE